MTGKEEGRQGIDCGDGCYIVLVSAYTHGVHIHTRMHTHAHRWRV